MTGTPSCRWSTPTARTTRCRAASWSIFEGAGHFPFRTDPARFVQVLAEFLASTRPATWEPADWRRLLREGPPSTRLDQLEQLDHAATHPAGRNLRVARVARAASAIRDVREETERSAT